MSTNEHPLIRRYWRRLRRTLRGVPADRRAELLAELMGRSRAPAPAASQTGTVLVVSTQIAVRLPDELVAYVDQAVAEGRVKSRAELMARLIERDARRQRAEQDLQRLTERGALNDPELLDIVKSASDTPLPID